MSTESETKSAGVPAGATHQCRVCKAFYRACGSVNTFYYLSAKWCEPACSTSDVRPIAEVGPAPTTAAPAEQLSGKVVCGAMPNGNPHRLNEHGRGGRKKCIDPRRAEQPGKAADPRPAQPPAFMGAKPEDDGQPYCGFCGKLLVEHGDNGECPAQPQAPAEPSRHWPDCALNHGGKECDMGPECGAAPTGQTPAETTLRAERDRLAGEVRDLNARIRKDGEYRERAETGLRAQVAERDARIARIRAVMEGSVNKDSVLFTQIAAALFDPIPGAPEGQPPAAKTERQLSESEK